MMTEPAEREHPVKGEVAVHRGVPYPARPAADRWPLVELLPGPGLPAPEGVPARYAEDGTVAGHPVAPERLDAWYAVHRTFRWHGEPFACTERKGGTIVGDYLGEDEGFAEEYLEERAISHWGAFPLEEVTDPEEHHEDLLGPRLALIRRLDEAHHFRPEAYAVLHGTTHAAAAELDPAGEVRLIAPDGTRPAVTPNQLDAWYLTHWTFTWRGGPFDAVGTDQGRIKGVYTGGSWGFADNYQLRPEQGPDGRHDRYTAAVDLDSVTDLEQHRTDLLAAHR
ncbi:hypothetical protein [Kitasatospora sp. NPDC088134]|uniref:hypothetical protein n=1 Tax=Kitasatospora sp. NPDC088134 TaxID=3364071 RepID=UPI00381D6D1C